MTEAARRSLRLSLQPEVRALQERIGRRMAGLTAETVERLYPALREVRAELAAGLKRYIDRHPDDWEAKWTAQKYRALMVQLKTAEEAARDLADAMGVALRTGGAAAGAYAVADFEQQIGVFSKAFGQPILLDIDSAAILARGGKLVLERERGAAHKYADDAVKDIRNQLLAATLSGETFFQVARRVARLGAFPGALVAPTVDGMAAGLWRRQLNRGYLVARTELMHVYNVHHAESLAEWAQQDAEALMMWDAADDRRTCQLCAGLDGEVADIGGTFAGGYSMPPDDTHACCRCRLVPWKRAWDTWQPAIIAVPRQLAA